MLVTLSASVLNWLRGNIRKGTTILQGMYTGNYAGKPNGKWNVNKPEGVCENKRHKLLWDMTIQCDQAIEARRPDIVFVDMETREVKIVDVAIPGDTHVKNKGMEKYLRTKS